jgi:perosamine synthetase
MYDAVVCGKLSAGSIGQELCSTLSSALEVPHVTLTTSGSVALLIVLHAWNIGPGDEVLIPNRTFQATANAVVFLGATPVLVDVQSHDSLIDVTQIKAKITNRTRAIIPVHLNGRICDIEKIREICSPHNILILEDSAQALSSKNSQGYAGTLGDAGIYSLGVTKFITSGQGGVIVTRSKVLHDKIQRYLFHGVQKNLEESFPEFGFNFRLPDALSALALKQAQSIPEIQESYLSVYRWYSKLLSPLSNIHLFPAKVDQGEVPVWTEVLTDRRDCLRLHLEKYNIETRPGGPNLSSSHYLNSPQTFSCSQNFHENLLILPSGPDLTYDMLKRIEIAFKEWK